MLSVTFVSIDALNAIMLIVVILIINVLNVISPLLVNCKGLKHSRFLHYNKSSFIALRVNGIKPFICSSLKKRPNKLEHLYLYRFLFWPNVCK
jgi:hypothetical protein